MRRIASFSTIALFAAASLVSTGCVQQDRYDQLLQAKRTTEEQLVRTEEERDAARASLDEALNDRARLQTAYKTLEGQYGELTGTVGDMEAANRQRLIEIQRLQIGPLPADVESALADLAASYPDVLAFDAKRGMMRFASDFTFDLSSANLRPEAAETVRHLAEILNSPNAKNLEVRIVGHTDDVPIGKPSTRELHPTNVHLSVHRSISVRSALVSASVEPVRIQVAGYGEHRPVVENRPGGTPENRRVEVFLTPMPAVASLPVSRTPTATADSDEPMK